VTEDAYQSGFAALDGSKSIHVSKWPVAVLFDEQAEKDGDIIRDVIGAIRTYKSERKLSLNRRSRWWRSSVTRQRSSSARRKHLVDRTSKGAQAGVQAELEEKVIALKPLLAKIGPTFKQKAKEVTDRIKALDIEKDSDAVANGTYEFVLSMVRRSF